MKYLILDRPDEVGAWVADRLNGQWWPGRGVGLGLAQKGHLIAGAAYTQDNGVSVQVDLAVAHPHALTRAFMHAFLWYPFVQLKRRKVIAQIGCKNDPSSRFAEHLGFKREATLSDACPDGDLWIYTLTAPDCTWRERVINRGISVQAESAEAC